MAMVDSKQISKTEKLGYLKSCLIGEAKKVADGFTEMSDSTYDSLLAELKTKYGQPRMIQRDHIYGLLELPSFQWKELPVWLTKFMTHIRCLESMGMDLEANSSFIVCIVQKRMPN